ncbi:hypothetical protein OHA77_07725 [Streptosporangium sp. NBC_01639]|uniref:hypothetical protein n=1 Tax=Streptosporangium sp. NBC_01639 TaxID=2975948 RepID=UPI00386AC19F|nr:hypothetical protein OHA77_07725 [Streptosporangium sp. NBC_01639]
MTQEANKSSRLNPEPRPDLVSRAVEFLPPGSEIRQAFIAQSAPNFLFFVVTYMTGLTMLVNKYRCVAVTKDEIYVLDSTKLSGGASPQKLLGTMPRRTKLGPGHGNWWTIELLGEKHWVHKRFFEQLAAADREAGFTA